MGRKKGVIQLPESLRDKVEAVRRPVSTADIDTYGKLREIQDRSHRIRAIVKAWQEQQAQDRKLREKYAHWLMVPLAAQA